MFLDRAGVAAICCEYQTSDSFGRFLRKALYAFCQLARNCRSKKTLKGDFGELPIDIPSDRQASFAADCAQAPDPLDEL